MENVTVLEYIKTFSNKLTKDDKLFFEFNYSNIIDIYKKIPNDLVNKEYFTYSLDYKGLQNTDIETFISEASLVAVGNPDLEGSEITVRINKNELLKNLYPSYTKLIYYNHKNYLDTLTFNNISKVSDNKKPYLIFLVEFQEEILKNDFQAIIPFNKAMQHELEFDTDLILDKFREIQDSFESKSISSLMNIPTFWYFQDKNEFVNKEFSRLMVQTFLNLISNKVENDQFLIKGHHNLRLPINQSVSIDNGKINYILVLTQFLCDDKRHYDKLLIVRNVLTTYFDNSSTFEDFILQVQNINNTVSHHFELYVQNEVKIFIEQKNQVLNEALQVSNSISALSIDLINLIRNISVSFFIGIIITFIPALNEDLFAGILTLKPLLIVILFLLLIFLAVNYFLSMSYVITLNNYKAKLEQYTKSISNQSLEGLDYASLEKQFLRKDITHFYKIYRAYHYGLLFLMGLLISLILGLFLFL